MFFNTLFSHFFFVFTKTTLSLLFPPLFFLSYFGIKPEIIKDICVLYTKVFQWRYFFTIDIIFLKGSLIKSFIERIIFLLYNCPDDKNQKKVYLCFLSIVGVMYGKKKVIDELFRWKMNTFLIYNHRCVYKKEIYGIRFEWNFKNELRCLLIQICGEGPTQYVYSCHKYTIAL